MGLRIWGTAEGRLIEVVAEPGGAGLRISGLPESRRRTTAERVRAALLNSGVVAREPAVVLRIVPAVPGGATWDLDLPLALAAAWAVGSAAAASRWLFATGRLGPDGSVHTPLLPGPITLGEVAGWMARVS